MQEKYLVSVIIPVYNSSLYLQDILDDVKKQTYKKLEIIVDRWWFKWITVWK